MLFRSPEFIPLSNLEKLNKEKEYVGIYLSAHPLDEYKIALDYGCNTTLAEMTEIEKLIGRDVITGGIVTGFREGISKKGSPYGFIKIEDYSGSYEFALFGNDFVEYRKFGYNGMYLLINGKVQPKRYRENEFEFKMGLVELLPDAKDRLLEDIIISIPLESIHQIGRAHV